MLPQQFARLLGSVRRVSIARFGTAPGPQRSSVRGRTAEASRNEGGQRRSTSISDTLVARVRGDGREYQLNLYTSARGRAFSYRAPMQTRKGEWVEARIPLDRFEATSFGQVIRSAGPVAPGSVTSVGFLLSEKTPGPFSLEVESITIERQGARLE